MIGVTHLCVLLISVHVACGFTARFCTINDAEDEKCKWIGDSLREKAPDLPQVECIRGQDSYDCLQMLQDGRADVRTKTWVIGVYIGGKYHNLAPLLRENTHNDSSWTPATHYIVAVVRRGSLAGVSKLDHLRGARACFPGVYSLGGWQTPVGRLAERGLLPRQPCRDSLEAVANFFNGSCTPGMSLKDKQRLPSLCAICKSNDQKHCTHQDPYSGYTGAVRCVLEGSGEIAFVRHQTFSDMQEKDSEFTNKKQELQLLCLDGSRKSIDSYEECNWNAIPDYATVVSANMESDHRKIIQEVLTSAEQLLPNLFNSSAFEARDVLFDDETVSLQDVGDRNDYIKYTGDYYDIAEHQYPCQEPAVKFCVISETERLKCRRWNDAIATRLLKPNVECVMADNKSECVRLIREDNADVTLLTVEDIYKQKVDGGFKIVMSEVYDKISDREQVEMYDWALAVVRKVNNSLDFTNLKGQVSCNPSVQSLTGWKIPVVSLSVAGHMNVKFPCGIRDAMKNFFTGIAFCNSTVNNSEPQPTHHQYFHCEICDKNKDETGRCLLEESLFGEEGSLRGLASNVCNVAFVKYSTLIRNIGADTWAKNLTLQDFQLLCTDGSTNSVDQYKQCNLATVPTSALVTRIPHDESDNIIDRIEYLFRQSEEYYGSQNPHDFNMYNSGCNRDLIFTDGIKGMQLLPETLRDPDAYVQNVKGYFQSTDEERCSPNSTTSP